MMRMIKTMQPSDVNEASALMRRNLLEINSRNYPEEIIDYLVNDLTPEKLLEKMETRQLFIALEGERIIGTGGLANYGSQDEPSYYGVLFFVLPELHRQGVGKLLVKTAETEARKLGAENITVRSAIGACEFYEKLGYKYPAGESVRDKLGNTHMEKTLLPE